MYDEFRERDTVVVAVAQEDTDLESHGKFHKNFDPAPRFEIVADLQAQTTDTFDRATAYLIDRKGVVRQVFPMTVQHRPSWWAVLNEIDRINDDSGAD